MSGVTPSPTHPWLPSSSVKMNDLYTVSKFRSEDTGMELIHARVDGPSLHCYWVVAHTLENDCGIPHMLQHMIWHGSKRYPYSGLFNHISNKCFSTGPKAWAEIDHSCYQITTAGKQGFCSLLPVVFDHIFNPLLQEATFLTEVFHMDGSSNDKGHCYEEVLQLERDPNEVANFNLLRSTFGFESNYYYNYAGTSSAIQSSDCTLASVREFHEKFYHATNCCLIVIGDIGKQDVLLALDPILGTLINDKKVRKGWTKPWLDQPLFTFSEPRMLRVEYPHPEWGHKYAGAVKVGILGPSSVEKLNRVVAMRLALEYLITGPVLKAFNNNMSALPSATSTRKSFASTRASKLSTERERLPLATHITVSEYELKQTVFSIEFHNVPKDLIPNLPIFLHRCIEGHLKKDTIPSGEDDPDDRFFSQFDDEDMGFDYKRMVQVVHHFYQNELAGMENFVEDKICQAVIPDWIYSREDSDLMFDRRINSAYTIHHFLSQPPEFWKMVIKTCFLEQSWATVGALPSKQLYDKLEEERLQKVEHRVKPENIKETKRAAQKYKAAKKFLERPHPPELLDKFRLPSMDSIGFIRILRQDNPEWAKDTLCNLYVDDINSNNVFITIIMDTSELTLDEKKYLVLFAEGILNSPYFDNSDKLHTAEDCEQELRKDVLKCETFFGLEWLGNLEDRTRFSCGSYPHLFCLRLKLDVEKTKEGFQWAQLLLWNTKWQADKLKNVAVRLMREVEFHLKKQGPVMTRAMLVDSLYLMNSTPKSVSLIRQKTFLRRIAEDLPKSIRKVTKMLESIRMTILRPENVTVHVAASIAKMEFHLTEAPHARDAVSQLFRKTFDYTGWHWGYDTKRLSNIADQNWMRSSDCIGKCSREQILRMENTTVGYLIQAAPGIRSWNDWEYPYLLIALQYFIQRDGGPLYMEIVETGLAKEIDIRVSPTEGVIYFEMRECTDLVQAYGKAFDIMLQHLSPANVGGDETYKWDLYLLRSAVSTMILRLTQEENTPTHVAMHSLLAYYKGKQLKDSRDLMGTISRASVEQVQATAKKYFQPLFLQPCTCAASAPSENAIQIIKDLMERCGKRLELIPPVEQSSLASYNQ